MKNSSFRSKNFNNLKLIAIVNNVVNSRTFNAHRTWNY